MNQKTDDQIWREVLEFWFPEGRSFQIDAETHRDRWFWRMRGGADSEIESRFSELTAEGAVGNLDPRASDSEGRLALIIVLDQFSRSVWRGNVRAFAHGEEEQSRKRGEGSSAEAACRGAERSL